MEDRGRKAMIWIIAVAVLTVILLLAVLVMPMDNARWNGMRNRVATLKQEARSRNVSRPVLRGKATPGNAWDEYNVAISLALTVREGTNADYLLHSFLAGDARADRAIVERLIAANPGVIDHLRLGAQRSNGQYPYQWDDGPAAELPSLLGSRRTSQLSIAQARVWEETRPQDASDLLLDTSQFASDLATNGPLLSSLVGLAVYQATLDELKNLVLSGKLTRQQLANLAKELESADRNFPPLGPTFTNEAALTGFGVDMTEQLVTTKQWLHLARDGGWRYGLSPRRMALDAFEQRDSYAQRSHNIDNLPFDAATKEARAITTEAEASGNPLLRESVPSLPKSLERHRDVHAHLLVLRAATIFLATGEMPQLPDPFGEHLSYSKEAGKLKIWSYGSDGKSQNGKGSWTAGSGEDVVLEISR